MTHVVVQARTQGTLPSTGDLRGPARRLAAFQLGLEAVGAVCTTQIAATGVTLHAAVPVAVTDSEVAVQVLEATATRVGLPPWEWSTTAAVVECDPTTLLDLAAVAERLGTTVSIATRWTAMPSFPAPAGTVGGAVVWNTAAVDTLAPE